MGRFMLNGKAAMLNGNFVEYNNGTLAFTVSGASFPMSYYASGVNKDNSRFGFESSESNTATIDYGDGSVITYTFKSNKLEFRVGTPAGDATRQVNHTYTDGNLGDRIIRITFGKIDKIINFYTSSVILKNSFPNEIGSVSKLESIDMTFCQFTNFPPSISTLTKLSSLNLINIGTAISQRIPDEFNELNLQRLSISSSIDMSDIETSNLKSFLSSSKRSQLQYLFIDGCKLSVLPDEIDNCTAIYQLHIGGNNNYETMPTQINNLGSLVILGVGIYYSSNSSLKFWSSISNLTKLIILDADYAINLETNLPIGIQNCIKLKLLRFEGTYQTTERIDEFITNFYDFIENYAAIKGLNTLPFRGMTLNCVSATGNAPSGIFQQPVDYEQEVYNGKPRSPKEMLWVLINQYGHTITYTA